MTHMFSGQIKYPIIKHKRFGIVDRDLLHLSGAHRICLGRPHDQLSSGIGAVVTVPGGVVHCLEGLCE